MTSFQWDKHFETGLEAVDAQHHAMARFAMVWSGATRDAAPLSCVMIDVDGFKRINDQYGHDAGDEVLRQLARQLRRAVRTDEVVCRLGGDEFLVICPNTAAAGATLAAENIRREVAALEVPMPDGGAWLGSISVGVAARTPAMLGTEDLMKAAGLRDPVPFADDALPRIEIRRKPFQRRLEQQVFLDDMVDQPLPQQRGKAFNRFF